MPGKSQRQKSGGNAQQKRAKPYAGQPSVEVRFEGTPAAANGSKSTTQKTVSASEKARRKHRAKVTVTGQNGDSTAKTLDKGKSKAVAADQTPGSDDQPSIPGSFIMVAGSYEKLLYGIEASYPSSAFASSSSSTGLPTPNLEPIFIFPAHLAYVKAIAASPGGKWLATGSEDEFIKVWDLRRRKEVGSLSQHSGSITSLHFPTTSHLVSTSADGTIALFRTSDWALLKSLKGHSGRVNHVDVHPTGRVALSVGKDATLKMWDLMRGRGAASLALGSEAELVRFSPLGTHFAVLFPKKVEIYSLTLKLLHTLETKNRFNTLQFAVLPSSSEDGADGGDREVLCVGTEKGIVEVYEVGLPEEAPEKDDDEEEDEEEQESERGASVDRVGTLTGHTNRIKALSILQRPAVGPDGPRKATFVSTVSSDGLMNLYDISRILADKPIGGETTLEPVGSYDTKGSRLTCCFLADGKKEIRAASNGPVTMTNEDDEDEDDGDEDEEMEADPYEQDEGDSEDGEDGVEVEFEDEEEEEEEEEEEGEEE